MSSISQNFDLQNLKGTIFFQSQDSEEENFHQRDLIQLFPFSMNVDITRPFLILKDKNHEHTLPVALNPLEAGVTLSQANKSIAPITTHRFSQLLLEKLSMKVEQAVFVEIKGVHQYLRMYTSGNAGVTSIKLRADEAMSLCLYLDVPLFATKSFIAKSKVMSAEIESMDRDFTRNHPYMN